jgi:RNA polymerase sigma-70 factor (sigma-E family)
MGVTQVADLSFEQFVRQSLPALGRYAYALTGGIEAGEDLVQDTLVKISKAWRRIRADGNPLAYARVVMLRTYVSAWRGLVRHPPPLLLTVDCPGPDAYGAADARDLLRRALAGLPRDQRAVLVLSYLLDLPDDEIAAMLCRRPGTVRSLRHRGLATLRRQLAEAPVEGVRGQG